MQKVENSFMKTETTTPHPPLRSHYQSLEDKQGFLRAAFDAAAPFYEGIARWGFFGSGQWYRKQALQRAGLRPGMKIVDVASGTGPTARAALEILGDPAFVTCVEPSLGMLQESQKLLPCVHVHATAEKIPLPDGEFDFLSMGFALRHVQNLQGTFREYFRLIKPGGRVCILDVTKPRHRLGQIPFRVYFKNVLPWLTRVFTGSRAAEHLMQYYWETMDNMVGPQVVLQTLEDCGFVKIEHRVLLSVFSEYVAIKPGGASP